MGRELSDDIADDIAEIFTDPNDFGRVVTHRPRSGVNFNIVGVFTQQSKPAQLTDNREGRTRHDIGSLITGLTDVDGLTVTFDDEGEFLIDGKRWAVAKVSPLPGGWMVTLSSVERKTMRHLPGNG